LGKKEPNVTSSVHYNSNKKKEEVIPMMKQAIENESSEWGTKKIKALDSIRDKSNHKSQDFQLIEVGGGGSVVPEYRRRYECDGKISHVIIRSPPL